LNSFDASRFASLLRTRAFGREFHYFEFLDSTNTRLKELAAQGAAEGALALAESQSAGRGRWGRHWESPAGKNLLFSFLLKPQAGQLSQLSAVFGLACLKALGLGRLKWPNDIWIDGRKVSGMLIEGSPSALIVGIGVNVNQGRDEFTPELRESATSLLLETGQAQDREALLAGLMLACEEAYGRWKAEGFEAMRGEWENSALFMGERVQAGAWEGRMLGMDEEGGLRIETAQGVEKLHTGEVFGLRPALD
jgi:BirA family biotin operon repressor/biotin-[acetyl-CoA-carboxylase] ligase